MSDIESVPFDYPASDIPYEENFTPTNVTGYPSMLAGGIQEEPAYLPFHLYAGEKQTVHDQGLVGAMPLAQFQVVAKDANNLLVPWEPNAVSEDNPSPATGAITFTGVPAVNDTLTINGVALTFIAAGAEPANENQVPLPAGATAASVAQAVKAAVNEISDESALSAVEITGGAAVLGVTASAEGTAGNAITLAKNSAAIAVSGATLSGGSNGGSGPAPESFIVGITAQPAAAGGNVPYFVDGIFNHAALVWPASCTTLEARKSAFQQGRTECEVRKLL